MVLKAQTLVSLVIRLSIHSLCSLHTQRLLRRHGVRFIFSGLTNTHKRFRRRGLLGGCKFFFFFHSGENYGRRCPLLALLAIRWSESSTLGLLPEAPGALCIPLPLILRRCTRVLVVDGTQEWECVKVVLTT